MKVVTIVGARPQFIKAAPVSKALREAGHTEFLLHTGQHYDYGMSQVFFDELGLPKADKNLNVRSGNHGKQTGQMLTGIEEILLAESPAWVLVFGDTNSTLAGALASVKLHTPLAHIEAGVRSFNREMPEEHNRVLTDHCANLLLCPTKTAVENLAREGLKTGVHLVGDPMQDAVLMFSQRAQQQSTILKDLGLEPHQYLLATVHRAENTDHPENLRQILEAFSEINEPIIFPIHPRTRACLEALKLRGLDNSHIHLIDPVGYLDMLELERNARMILTDSGGIQKEAYFFCVPCITLRMETEWVETVQAGWNVIAGTDKDRIIACIRNESHSRGTPPSLFGDGQAAQTIVNCLETNKKFTNVDDQSKIHSN